MPVPDFSPGEVLTAAAMDSIGLWKVSETNFTNQPTVDIANCFTTDYQNYRIQIVITSTASTNTQLNLRLFNGGTTLASGYANFGFYVGSPGSGAFFTDNFTATLWAINQIGGNTPPAVTTIDMFGPRLTQRTAFTFQSFATYNSGGLEQRVNINGACSTTSTDQFPSLRILNGGSANMTGTVRIYGYRN